MTALLLVVIFIQLSCFKCGPVCGYSRGPSTGPYYLARSGSCPPGHQVDQQHCLEAAKSVGADQSKRGLDNIVADGADGAPGGCTLHDRGNVEWWGIVGYDRMDQAEIRHPTRNKGRCGDYGRSCVCIATYQLLKSGYCPLDRQLSRGECEPAVNQLTAYNHIQRKNGMTTHDSGGPGGCTLHALGDVEWWGFDSEKSKDQCGAYSRYCVCKTASGASKNDQGNCPRQVSDLSSFKQTAWSTYYKLVYGSFPATGYPIKPFDLWMLYDKKIEQAQVSNAPISVGDCLDKSKDYAKPQQYQRFNHGAYYQPPGVSWLWHAYPYRALPPNSWQEVLHQADPFGDEHFGCWFLYAPGSGVYFQMGKTKSFPEHQQSYTFFKVSGGNWNEEMSKNAAAAGYDSVQFLEHVDHINYPCDRMAGLKYMGLEIVATRLTGTYSCGDRTGRSKSLRAGWEASVACVCNNRVKFTNCQYPGLETTSEMALETNSSIAVV